MLRCTAIVMATLVASFSSKAACKQSKVVNGIYVKINQFSYCAFLLVKEADDQMYGCGSSILNQNFVLTAAHCLNFVESEHHVSILVGEAVYSKGLRYDIVSFLVHTKYHPHTFANDIAVATTAQAIAFSAKVGRVSIMILPPKDTTGVIAGWGLVHENPSVTTDQLTYAEQRIWSYKECLKEVTNLPKGNICAGEKNGLQHASYGDSGSALVVRSGVQVGIASAQHGQMVTYTHVPHYYHWIRDTVMALSCQKSST